MAWAIQEVRQDARVIPSALAIYESARCVNYLFFVSTNFPGTRFKASRFFFLIRCFMVSDQVPVESVIQDPRRESLKLEPLLCLPLLFSATSKNIQQDTVKLHPLQGLYWGICFLPP